MKNRLAGRSARRFFFSVSRLLQSERQNEPEHRKPGHDDEGIGCPPIGAHGVRRIHHGDGDADDGCEYDDAEGHGELAHSVDDGGAVRDIRLPELGHADGDERHKGQAESGHEQAEVCHDPVGRILHADGVDQAK